MCNPLVGVYRQTVHRNRCPAKQNPKPGCLIQPPNKFSGKRAYVVGKRYGTIGLRHEGHFLEVTTYRSELYDLSSRKPAVVFTEDLATDLSRRDFTINAMALSYDGRLIDPYQGAADLAAKVIRTVGQPSHRFREDPLRMLRLIRFVARYGFAVEAKTKTTVSKRAHSLQRISHERISSEFDGIIVAPHAVQALQLLAELHLLPYSVPLLAVQVGFDQNSPYHSLDLWNHSLQTLGKVEAEVTMRWAALLHDIGKPFVRQEKPGRSIYIHHDAVGSRLVDMIAWDLRWSNDRRATVKALVADHMADTSPLRAADNAAKSPAESV